MHLTELPVELLAALPSFIRNLEDYTNAASTCRTLRIAFALAAPHTILRLAASSAPTFFSPHPWFLVMATARQVSDWAVGSESRTQELRRAFQGGISSLYDLCLHVGGLTMEDIRRLHLARFSTINPLANKIDQMAGSQWYGAPAFWNGGVSEAWTVSCEPERSVFHIMVYWELFGSTLRAYLEPDLGLPKFDLATRLDFIKYCIPDWICNGGYPGLEVLPIGPYLPGSDTQKNLPADQIALQFILNCGRWQRLWEKPMFEVGPDFANEWRQALWKNSCMSFGMESMEIVTEMKVTSEVDSRYLASQTVQPDRVLTPAWHQRLSRVRAQIEQLDAVQHRPRTTVIGTVLQHPVSDAPNLAEETYVCMAALWPGAM
ncbi:hypothetical protein BP5796_07688 [Coleophoma crateriformis]|uniref:Uncharacterized protein n=1 Tax=Coleophoma crateriformis TaxID=565419 RepID=A0A3D8RCR1_9HELO|nr:hypothetical protein BP5796_07688 [Coleophoma crateriformis]